MSSVKIVALQRLSWDQYTEWIWWSNTALADERVQICYIHKYHWHIGCPVFDPKCYLKPVTFLSVDSKLNDHSRDIYFYWNKVYDIMNFPIARW
jgi:hypothetical protein